MLGLPEYTRYLHAVLLLMSQWQWSAWQKTVHFWSSRTWPFSSHDRSQLQAWAGGTDSSKF